MGTKQSLAPISAPVSMEKFAYDAIKEAILTFKLQPGESLVEVALAAQLNTSKTPVRDALTHLVREGFVEKIPFKGYTVGLISRQAMVELFEIRGVLEGLATRHAVERMSADEIGRAENLVREHSAAAAAGDTVLASQINHRFHNLLIECSGSERIISILTNLDEHLQRYRLLSNISAGRLEKSAREHEEIMQAIRSGNAHDAEISVRRHLASVIDDLARQDIDLLATQVSSFSF